jgi:hypothetical protein
VSGIIIGPRQPAKAGAKAPARAPNSKLQPQRYRVLFSQTTIHVHYVEASDAETAAALASHDFAGGLHSCLAGCCCTQPDVVDVIQVTNG